MKHPYKYNNNSSYQKIIDFWFNEISPEQWWGKTP